MLKMIAVTRHTPGGTTELRNAVYVGRTNGVQRQYLLAAPHLANPYRVGRDGTREQVIQKYRRWLWRKIKAKDGAVLNELRDLLKQAESMEGVILVCHCSPQLCHGDVIARALEWLDNQE